MLFFLTLLYNYLATNYIEQSDLLKFSHYLLFFGWHIRRRLLRIPAFLKWSLIKLYRRLGVDYLRFYMLHKFFVEI